MKFYRSTYGLGKLAIRLPVGGQRLTTGQIDLSSVINQLGPMLGSQGSEQGRITPTYAGATAPVPSMGSTNSTYLALSKKEVGNIVNGVNALDSLIQESQKTGGIQDAWKATKLSLQMVKAIPIPVVSAIAEAAGVLVDIIYDLFGDKPCDFSNKENCKYTEAVDGTRSGYGKCCNPYPIASGRGVMVVEHAAGYKTYPGAFGEIPAGMYYSLDGKNVPREFQLNATLKADSLRKDIFRVAPFAWTNANMDGMLVPDGWAVIIYSGVGFQGSSKQLGPGWYDLRKMGFGDNVSSMKVVGTWSVIDRMVLQALHDRTSGWLTERAKIVPDADTLLALMAMDPLRPRQPGYTEYESVWRPGWYLRLSEAGALESDAIKLAFAQLGLTPADLATEKVISMEKTIETLKLLKSTQQIQDKDAATALVERAFNVEQTEIAKLLSRYPLDPQSIDKLIQVMGEELVKARKAAGVSETAQLWNKPHYNLRVLEREASVGRLRVGRDRKR